MKKVCICCRESSHEPEEGTAERMQSRSNGAGMLATYITSLRLMK